MTAKNLPSRSMPLLVFVRLSQGKHHGHARTHHEEFLENSIHVH